MKRCSLLFITLAACAPGEGSDAVTWWKDVKPLFETRCVSCHTEGGIAPMPLTDYPMARATAGAIAAEVTARRMPPWPPAPTMAYRHDRRLTDDEIALVQKWVRDGAVEGNEADYVAPDPAEVVTLDADIEIAMEAPYRPDTSRGTDDYRCFVLDPKLETDRAVTGYDIRPGDRRVVHHVIIFAVEPQHQGSLQQREDEDPEVGYTCFGDARVSALMVGAWVPGTTATEFPFGTGVVLRKGTKLVIQVHYNTLEVQDAEDLTTALLQTVPASRVSSALIFPIGDTSFEIPPGEIGSTKAVFDTTRLGLPPGLTARIHGSAPHMHLLGKSLTVELVRKDGSKLTLMDVPRWDFHWQQLYFYEDPVVVEYGDQISIECTWDNRELAQPIINGRRREPVPLRWGEGTLEEMCLNFFYATY